MDSRLTPRKFREERRNSSIFVAFFAAIANIDEIVQLTKIGTLFAFVLVCIGILVLRVREPQRPRKFRTSDPYP